VALGLCLFCVVGGWGELALVGVTKRDKPTDIKAMEHWSKRFWDLD
jgi:hypothetical protein